MRRWLKEFFISSEERMKIENEFPNIPKMLTITLKNINNKLFTDNTRVRLDYVTILNRILKLNFKF